MRIAGKVFVVTGGGDGIGREVVLELLRRGGRVAAIDVRGEALAETTARAASAQARPTAVTAVRSSEIVAIQALVGIAAPSPTRLP